MGVELRTAAKEANGGREMSGSEGFRSKMERYLYSGEKKHVLVGFAIAGIIFGGPWFYMSRGTKHQSHQDYMEKADRARNERFGHSTVE